MYCQTTENLKKPILLYNNRGAILRYFFIGICCWFGFGNVDAQVDSCQYTVEGKVLDIDTKAPLPYVSVRVKDTEKFTFTEADGTFYIDGLCNNSNTLIISCFGYCDTTCEHHHHQHDQVPHIYMTQQVIDLNSVVITAEKTQIEGTSSLAQLSVPKEALASKSTRTLAAALADEAGISMASVGSNVQLPIIHGLYGNRILVLNNGIKHGFQNWGGDHAPEIDISAAHRITILKGAAGVRFGPEALGGAIVVKPNPLYLNEPFFAEVGTGYQTNGRGGFSTIEFGQGYDKWSYYAGGKFMRLGDMHTPDYSLTNSGKAEQSLRGGLRYRLDKWSFKLHYSYVNQNLALLRTSIAESGTAFIRAINAEEPTFIRPFSYDINEPNQLNQHHLGKAEIDWWYAEDAKLTLRIGQQLNKHEEYDVRRNADRPIVDLDLITSDYQLDWKHPDWKHFDGLIGLQLFTQNNDNNPGTGTTPLIPNYNTTRFSAFLIESLKEDKHTFEVGLRLDHERANVRGRETNQDVFRDEFNFTNLTASAGYIRELSDEVTIRTNLGLAWRTPNMAELFTFGQHGFQTTFGLLRYYTNAEGDLRTDRVIPLVESEIAPERGLKWINEWRQQTDRHRLTLTAYSHFIENFIFERPLAVIGTVRGPMPLFIFDQTDALFLGADFTWEQEWTTQLSGRYSLSYLWTGSVNNAESPLNQPPMTTAYELSWTLPKLGKVTNAQFTLRPSYTFRQWQAPRTIRPEDLISGAVQVNQDSETFDFKDAPDGFFLLEAGWRGEIGRFRASVSVQNLTNIRYRDYLNEMRYFADEPGRNLLLSLNYRIGK